MLSAADIQTIRDADPGAVLPGIDTMTGNPYATSSLLDLTKITQNSKAPFYYSPSQNAYTSCTALFSSEAILVTPLSSLMLIMSPSKTAHSRAR